MNGELVASVHALCCGGNWYAVADSCCIGVEASAILAFTQRELGAVHCVGRRRVEKVGAADRLQIGMSCFGSDAWVKDGTVLVMALGMLIQSVLNPFRITLVFEQCFESEI